jgi:lipopolysaccharide transport protein LptA
MTWQKRARFGVAVFGIVCAGVVYSALGERQAPSAPRPIQRQDPKAIYESAAGRFTQARDASEDFTVTFERQLAYENGRSKWFGVHIKAKERGGARDFDVMADEAEAGENERILQLSGHIKLSASDGFTLATEHATFNRDQSVVHTDDRVTFGKARMSGSGTVATYNQISDVLTIGMGAHVEMRDEHDAVTLDFNAGAATLDRMQDLLTLDGTVHVVRGNQIIDADHAVAHMDSEDQFITLLELRGNSRVEGSGGSLDAMSARDIDLHYSPDGKLLEQVVLNGGSGIALTGDHGAPGRTISGDAVTLQLASDGSLMHVTASDPMTVQLVLPASEGAPSRRIQAHTFDANGAPGKGLTDARFTDAVEFHEEPAAKGSSPRTVRARALTAALTEASVSDAVFTGAVHFEEQALTADAAELHYLPDNGVLELKGIESGHVPHVADEQIAIDAQTITVTLQGRHMVATNAVKTVLRPHDQSKQASGAASSETGRMPGLLKQDQQANVNATALDYDGDRGLAKYTGTATLWQGDTSVRGDTVVIDQQKGDLVAIGSAVLRMALDTGDSIGQAHEIRYEDARREITYTPIAGPRSQQPHLSGPQGDLRADRIELYLERDDAKLDRLEAYSNVTMTVDAGTPSRRTATGGRLTYRAATEQYDMVGSAVDPVKVTESCREIRGKTLTFYKSADRITVDGNDEIRTETKSSGPCSQSAAPRASRP